MQNEFADSRSPAAFLAVALAHAIVIALLLTQDRSLRQSVPTRPIAVRLIVPAVVPPPPAAVPEPPRPQPPAKPLPKPVPLAVPPPPVPTPATPPPPAPRPVETPTEPVRAAPATAPAPEPVESVRAAPPPLVQPRFNADYLENPKPTYPSVSRRMGEEGEVRLKVLVDAAGNPQQVEIERSSGYPRLDQAALDTVKRWRFVPARRGEQPVAATVIVPIQFTLRN